MKLEFSLLVADDNPNSLRQAVESLRDHLDSKGFDLTVKDLKDFSSQELHEVTEQEGKNYDLVAIDYNLGQEQFNGTDVARQLRHKLPYTDMIFYSSDPTADLLSSLAKHRVSGVFAETRAELDTALIKLADTVIGKAIDLNHMRGIAIAQVAEMDVMMEEALIFVLESSSLKASQVDRRTKKRLVENMENRLANLKDKLAEGLIPVILDSNLFSSSDRFRAITRMIKAVEADLGKENEVLKSYGKDIIDNRNLLAHAKEETGNDNQSVLRSTKQGEVVIIDEDWMQGFRKKLRAHRRALEIVCEALRNEFGFSSP